MTDQPFRGLTRTPDPTFRGATRNQRSSKGSYALIRGAIQHAEELAWSAIASGHPTAEELHGAMREALEFVDAILFPAEGCEGPDCSNPLQYKGVGRPARYCSARCKDRAAYRAKRQRLQRGEG
ncbi:Syd protein [Streptomyces sp. NBRC 110611]|nr:Syd protein [Streptomyces sp. NBRC 110611]